MSPKAFETFAWFVVAIEAVILILGIAALIVISQDALEGAPITRVIDDEADVVCYLYREANTGRGGLSCLPLSETSLSYGD